MKDKDGEHPFGDSGQLVLLAVFLAAWVLDSFVFKWTTLPVPAVIRIPLAAVVFALAILVINASHKVVHEGRDSLITTGVFRLVRHPLYLGSMLAYLALVLLTFSLISAALFVGIFCFYNFLAIFEERVMTQKFGAEYQQYKSKTGRWLPRL